MLAVRHWLPKEPWRVELAEQCIGASGRYQQRPNTADQMGVAHQDYVAKRAHCAETGTLCEKADQQPSRQ